MEQISRVEVVYPILVPKGAYCWKYDIAGTCDYFDNEGGHASCELKFHGQKQASKGILKAPKCAALKII